MSALSLRVLRGQRDGEWVDRDLIPEARLQGENYVPPPPSPSWPEGIFKGEGGGGVHVEAPRRQEFYTPPPLLHTPHP